MKTEKSINEDKPSHNRKRGKSLDQYKDEQLGKVGTIERDLFELELKRKLYDKEN